MATLHNPIDMGILTDMDSAAETLLVIVSSTLAVFLVLASVALTYFIKLLRVLRAIAEKAENVADSVEAAAETFERSAGPVAVLKLIGNIIDNAAKLRRKK